jgi:oligoribonuclease (3'-5' exoribonuclease)
MDVHVLPFNRDNLVNLVKESIPKEDLSRVDKRQIHYIFKYIDGYSDKKKSLAFESVYIDQSFLEDHSQYYNRCFNNYRSHCSRIHFFDIELEVGQVIDNLLDPNSDELFNSTLQDNYLGFITITPLPTAVIGRSCLTHYQSYTSSPDLNENSTSIENKAVISQSIPVNLYGIELKVLSVPFIEQDQITSACASAALWSFLHANPDYRSDVPAPSKITKLSNIDERGSYPSSGLEYEQILNFIAQSGLEPKYQDLDSEESTNLFFNELYAHISYGHPVLLGCKQYEIDADDNAKFVGRHIVNAVGYSASRPKHGPRIINRNITSLLIHDDQQGPYIKCSLNVSKSFADKKKYNTNDSPKPNIHNNLILLESKIRQSDFSGNKTKDKTYVYLIENYILGTYHKIRLPLKVPSEFCRIFESYLSHSIVTYFFNKLNQAQDKESIENGTNSLKREIVWEYKLLRSNDYKKKLRNSYKIFGKGKLDLLSKSWPRYIWVARCYLKGEKLYDFIFDCTDIPGSKSLFDLISWRERAEEWLKIINSNIEQLKKNGNDNSDVDFSIHQLDFYAKSFLKVRKTSRLDRLYGPVRPPFNLNTQEIELTYQTKIAACALVCIPPNKIVFQESNLFIWVINKRGELVVADNDRLSSEIGPQAGHPSLTGGELCRSAGEFYFDTKDNIFVVNTKSGRYFGPYSGSDLAIKNHYINSARLILHFLSDELETFELHYHNGKEVEKKVHNTLPTSP